MQIAKYVINRKSSSKYPFHLIVHKGSVTTFCHNNGAIVNAANETCLGGGGVDGAISAAGGPNLLEDRLALPIISQEHNVRCPTGHSKITGPNSYGSLHTNYVIHSVGPNYWSVKKTTEADALLQSAYFTSLECGKDNNLDAIAFSLLSAGVFKGPKPLKDVLRIGIETIIEYEGYKQLKEVHMYGFNDIEVKILVDVIESYPESVERL